MARKALVAWMAALLTQTGNAAQAQHFHLSQANIQLPEIRAYADILDEAGNPVADPGSLKLAGSIGGRPLKFISLVPFEKTNNGIACVFVVDTSESIETQRFDNIRSAIGKWVDESGAKDRAAVIDFAEKVHVLADFSDAKGKTLAAVRSLARGGKRSLIYQALREAIDVSSRHDQDLPLRRAIVIVTDGKDEGSGLRPDDVLEQAAEAHVPIYAIGYSNLPAAERRQYLDELHRMAEKSGGTFTEASAAGLTDAFPEMRKAIRRVFEVSFQCPDCEADGKKSRLEIEMEAGTRAFSGGFDVRMSAGQPPASTSSQPPLQRPAPSPSPWWKQPWWVYAVAGLALAGTGAGVWTSRDRRRKARERKLRAQEFVRPAIVPSPLAGMTAKIEGHADPAARPLGPAVRVQFTAVKGKDKGSVSEVRMNPSIGSGIEGAQARLVVGRKPGCDLSIPGDETVSGEHCELHWIGTKLVVRDLRSSNGTRVNGVPVAGDQPIESGDRLGIGQTEYRVGVQSDAL
jgi:VWFA-related protein